MTASETTGVVLVGVFWAWLMILFALVGWRRRRRAPGVPIWERDAQRRRLDAYVAANRVRGDRPAP